MKAPPKPIERKTGSVRNLPSSFGVSGFNALDSVSRTASSLAQLIENQRSKEGLIDRNGDYSQPYHVCQNMSTGSKLRLPGNLMGIKVPQMGIDAMAISYNADRLRMQKAENNESIERVLQNYFKQSSAYTSNRVKQTTQPEKNFRLYIENQVSQLNRISADNIKRRIINQNLAEQERQRREQIETQTKDF